jgi:putative ATPase subunit of terminase (gpP-like)
LQFITIFILYYYICRDIITPQGGIAMDTYSVREIADMLNTNPETVRRWIRPGKLEAIQESRKC